MKTTSYLACLFAFGLFFSSCTNENAATENGTADSVNETNDSDQDQLADITDHYLEIKDALVKSNPSEVSKASEKLLKTVNENGEKGFANLRMYADKMAGTNELEQQREVFELLSDEFYAMVKDQNIDQTLYRQYCPMAFNNEGAYWISAKEEIENPYYGDKMLKCGKVTDVIK